MKFYATVREGKEGASISGFSIGSRKKQILSFNKTVAYLTQFSGLKDRLSLHEISLVKIPNQQDSRGWRLQSREVNTTPGKFKIEKITLL